MGHSARPRGAATERAPTTTCVARSRSLLTHLDQVLFYKVRIMPWLAHLSGPLRDQVSLEMGPAPQVGNYIVPSLNKHLLAQHILHLLYTQWRQSYALLERLVLNHRTSQVLGPISFFGFCLVSNEPMNGKNLDQALPHSKHPVNSSCGYYWF